MESMKRKEKSNKYEERKQGYAVNPIMEASKEKYRQCQIINK